MPTLLLRVSSQGFARPAPDGAQAGPSADGGFVLAVHGCPDGTDHAELLHRLDGSHIPAGLYEFDFAAIGASGCGGHGKAEGGCCGRCQGEGGGQGGCHDDESCDHHHH